MTMCDVILMGHVVSPRGEEYIPKPPRIRPLTLYNGPEARAYVALEKR